MTDHNAVPTIATGDYIDAAWLNQYIKDNFAAIFQGLATAGSVAYAIDANTVGELVKPLVDSYLKNTSGGVPSWAPATDVAMPIGATIPFAGSAAPTGYLVCDGAEVNRTTYAALFAIIGTTWGVGNGTTTFNVPDLRGRTVIGVGTGAGLTARALAALVGEENHQLSIAELAAHDHTYYNESVNQTVAGGALGAAYSTETLQTSSSTGSDTPHNTMQPSAALNWIIKT